jgi:phage baseplate assembly protein W|tara:strand:- start:11376 stop:11876 length:501 start_codon:yes stop_codon:yes gene_type:complete
MPEKPLDIILDDTLRVGGSQVFDQDESIAIGVALPITKGNAGYFQQEYITLHQLKHNIKNLILTMKGERPMLPTFGTEIYSTLFEQDDGSMSEKIKESVIEALKIWLPFVKLENLQVLSLEGDAPGEKNDGVETHRNSFNIKLDFSLQNDPTMLESISLQVTGPEI